MKIEDLENFELTKKYQNPELRYFYGHFITGLEFRDKVIG
jgi:hypothetical protein